MPSGRWSLGWACKVRLHPLPCPACRALPADIQTLPRLLKEALDVETAPTGSLQPTLDRALEDSARLVLVLAQVFGNGR